MNLTAITSPEGGGSAPFCRQSDAAFGGGFQRGRFPCGRGHGAGFPSVPLAIMRPDMQFTLVDSLNKRITFLEAVKSELGLDFKTVHGRAEELGRDVKYREKFDFATARAVAGLNVLCEYCLPFVKKGGSFWP